MTFYNIKRAFQGTMGEEPSERTSLLRGSPSGVTFDLERAERAERAMKNGQVSQVSREVRNIQPPRRKDGSEYKQVDWEDPQSILDYAKKPESTVFFGSGVRLAGESWQNLLSNRSLDLVQTPGGEAFFGSKAGIKWLIGKKGQKFLDKNRDEFKATTRVGATALAKAWSIKMLHPALRGPDF